MPTGGTTQFDAIVIGGGPAGSTFAARLAQRRRRVLLLEKDHFPRFHIGESLLPCSMPLLDELGVMPAIRRADFLPKHAAEFITGDGSLQRRYPFAEGVVPGPASAYEVDRSEFDRILLDHSRDTGADVRCGFRVTRVDLHASHVEVAARGADGAEHVFTAEVLVDGSGQASFLAGRLGLRDMDPELKNFAVYSHYEGAQRHAGDREGDITVVLAPLGWWWVIPLRGDRTSLGLVAPTRWLGGRKADAEYLDAQIAATPYLAERFRGATRVGPVRAASDYSYRSRQLTGARWLLLGDAAAFIDPVFSTGVHLGMSAAFRAAVAVDRALDAGTFSRRAWAGYDRWLGKVVDAYRDFVKGFYTPEFVEVMMRPSDRLQLRQAVTSLLAGHGIDRFEVTWRIHIFRAITYANRRWRLTPRLTGRREAALSHL